MPAESFRFILGDRRCFAMGHAAERVTLCIDSVGDVSTSLRMTAVDARRMAVALEAAATFAENVIAGTGLGESAVDTAGADARQRVEEAMSGRGQ